MLSTLRKSEDGTCLALLHVALVILQPYSLTAVHAVSEDDARHALLHLAMVILHYFTTGSPKSMPSWHVHDPLKTPTTSPSGLPC